MPTTLPVPSKGALRALRNLALGTSCTIAISAAVLTEDRRRRIHAAREIHSNAQRIKSARNYTAGAAAIQSFEDQVLSYQDEEFWRAGNTPNHPALSKADHTIDLKWQDLNSSTRQIYTLPSGPQDSIERQQRVVKFQPRYKSARNLKSTSETSNLFVLERPTLQLSNNRATPVVTKIQGPSPLGDGTCPEPFLTTAEASLMNDETQKRQERLANDVTKLLAESPSNIEDAAARFFGTFEEGLPVNESGLSEILINATVKLGKALEQHSKFELLEQIFEIFSRYGPIHEEQYNELTPERVIRNLLRRAPGDSSGLLPTSNLEKATSIYLVRFREKPRAMTPSMLNLGERLCRETCQSGLYSSTLLIFRRLDSCRGHGSKRAVADLILATHKLGHHRHIFHRFDRHYTHATPNELQHWKTVNLVIDSILQTNHPRQAEVVLTKATDMAKAHGITMSTTAVLKVLGFDWRTYKDISRTKNLFERLESIYSTTNHPQACYGAMIQFCVEANDESAAEHYFTKFRRAYEVIPEDVCIYGHLARAKALREDWAGVENDFQEMKRLAPTRHVDFSASFTPILKIFAESHSPGETEEFIQNSVDTYDLHLTRYMINIMVNAYSKAKEVHSIARWIKYTSSIGLPIDSVSFNTILGNCYKSWKFSGQEVFDMFESVLQIDDSSRYFDRNTASILRQISLTDGRGLPRKLQLILDSLERSDNVADPHNIRLKMASGLAKNAFNATLRTYTRALSKNIPLDAQHLHLAIKATLSLDPTDLDACIALIEDGDRRGWEIQSAIALVLTHQGKRMFSNGNDSTKEFVDIAQQSILDFEKRGFKVSLNVVTHTMSILQRTFQFRAALEFWETTSHRLGLSGASLDLPILTVFLNIYIGLRYSAGIQWVLGTLSTNKLIPDYRFRQMLKNERRRMAKLSRLGSCSQDMLLYACEVEEACRNASKMGEQSRVEKDNVKLMTVKIIEKAIAERHMERSKNDIPNTAPELSLDHALTEEESWGEAAEESDVDISSPLALVAGG